MTRPMVGSDLGKQPVLLTFDVRDLLPADHPAFKFVETVCQLDTSQFEATYRADGVGRPPYDPRVMLALILYCWSKHQVSGQQIADACRDDLGARMITGNRFPDRSTINGFVRTHGQAIQALLPQTLRLGHELGLVDVSLVAGDGSKVVASAALSANVDEATVVAQIADLQQQLNAAQQEWHTLGDAGMDAPSPLFGQDDHADDGEDRWSQAADAAARRRVQTLQQQLRSRQTALQHLRSRPNQTPRWEDELAERQQRVRQRTEQVQATRARLEAHQQRRRDAQANGTKIPGTRPVSVEEHSDLRRANRALATATARLASWETDPPKPTRVNTTDPTSRIMPGKHDGYNQRYNLQILVCRKQFILAVDTHDNANDKQAMQNLVHTGRANLDAAAITDPIGTALFDCGYASAANFAADLPVDLLLVAVDKEARQTGRLRDGTTIAGPTWHDMATRLEHPDNRALYKHRSATVEPVFAQLFQRFGNALHYRGENVLTELHLWAITHNLLKVHRAALRRKPT